MVCDRRYSKLLSCSLATFFVVSLLVPLSACYGSELLRERCEQILAEQREYDKLHKSLSVATALEQMTKEMRKQPIQEVLPLLQHAEWEIRLSASRAIVGNEEARRADVLAAVAKVLASEKNKYVLPEMVRAASFAGAKEATPVLCEIMLNSEDAETRYAAVESQNWLKDPRSVPALIRAAADADSKVANRAIWVLGQIRDREALPTIREAAFNGKGDRQILAIQVLGIMGDSDSAEKLLGMLDTDNEALLAILIRSLGYIKYEKSVKRLTGFLSHPNAKVADESFKALVHIGNREVFNYFLEKWRADPEDQLAAKGVERTCSRVIAGLPNQKDSLPEGDLKSLAEHISGNLPERLRKNYVRVVTAQDITSVRVVSGSYFVSTGFEWGGLQYAVGKDEHGKWGPVRLLGYFVH